MENTHGTGEVPDSLLPMHTSKTLRAMKATRAVK